MKGVPLLQPGNVEKVLWKRFSPPPPELGSRDINSNTCAQIKGTVGVGAVQGGQGGGKAENAWENSFSPAASSRNSEEKKARL